MRDWGRITILGATTIIAGTGLLTLARRSGREIDSGNRLATQPPDAIAQRIPDGKSQPTPEPDTVAQRIPDEVIKGTMFDDIERNRYLNAPVEQFQTFDWITVPTGSP